MMDTETLTRDSVAAKLRGALEIVQSYDSDHGRNENGVGFSKFDGPTARDLLAGHVWSDREVRKAAVLVNKYRGQLRGFGAEAVAWVNARPAVDRTEIGHNGHRFIAAFESSNSSTYWELKDRVKSCGFRWDETKKQWWSTDPAIALCLAQNPGWTLSERAEAQVAQSSAGKAVEAAPARRPYGVEVEGKLLRVTVPFDSRDSLKALVYELGGKPRWEQETKSWLVDGKYGEKICAWAASKGWKVPADKMATLVEFNASMEAKLALSSALKCDPFLIPGLHPECVPMVHQYVAVKWINEERRTLVADEIGCGKSWEVLAGVAVADAWPLLIVCPAVLKDNWRQEINGTGIMQDTAVKREGFFPDKKVHVMEGISGVIPKDCDVVIGNYDIMQAHKSALEAYRFGSMAVDEGHFIKNPRAERTKACRAVAAEVKKRDGIVLYVTSTPVMNRIDELGAALTMVDRLTDVGFASESKFNKSYKGASQRRLVDLNKVLRGRGVMVRRLKKDVLTSLPPLDVTRVPLDVSKEELVTYRKAEAEFVAYIMEVAARKALEIGEDPRSASVRAAMKAEVALVLMQLTALRVEAAHAKFRALSEWVDQFLEDTSRKLVVFGIHRSVTVGLGKKFGCPVIIGGMTDRDRAQAVRKFQTDPDCKLIVCSIDAAGFGLTLTAASDVAVCELPWNPAKHAQAAGRIHRIGQLADVCTVHDLVIPNTIDDKMQAILRDKAILVDAVTDGEMPDEDELGSSVMAEVLGMYLDEARNNPDN